MNTNILHPFKFATIEIVHPIDGSLIKIHGKLILNDKADVVSYTLHASEPFGKYSGHQRIKKPFGDMILDQVIKNLATFDVAYQTLMKDVLSAQRKKDAADLKVYQDRMNEEQKAFNNIEKGNIQSLLNYLNLGVISFNKNVEHSCNFIPNVSVPMINPVICAVI